MTIAKKGDTVRVHYTGTLNDGTMFDSSIKNGRPPLEFKIGAGQMIPGFDKGVEGMETGEKKMLVLEPKDAYGERNEENVFTVPADKLPEGYTPHVGDNLLAGYQRVTVAKINEDGSVEIDANHELAGKTLNFEVELVEIVK